MKATKDTTGGKTDQTAWLVPAETPFPGFSLPVHSGVLAGMLFEAARSYAKKAEAESSGGWWQFAHKAHAMAAVIESAGANSMLEIVQKRGEG